MMTFSEFAKLLYPILGGGKRQAEFVEEMIDNITENTDGDDFELPDYLPKIFNGSKPLPRKYASYIAAHMDTKKFEDYVTEFTDDAVERVRLALSRKGYEAASKYEAAATCAGIFADIIDTINGIKPQGPAKGGDEGEDTDDTVVPTTQGALAELVFVGRGGAYPDRILVDLAFRPAFAIGRKSKRPTATKNDFDFDNKTPHVSRSHLRIECCGNEFRVHDMETPSGTYVNSRRVEPGEGAALRDKDVLSIGRGGADYQFLVRKAALP
jgi:hypothetical protein